MRDALWIVLIGIGCAINAGLYLWLWHDERQQARESAQRHAEFVKRARR